MADNCVELEKKVLKTIREKRLPKGTNVDKLVSILTIFLDSLNDSVRKYAFKKLDESLTNIKGGCSETAVRDNVRKFTYNLNEHYKLYRKNVRLVRLLGIESPPIDKDDIDVYFDYKSDYRA